VSKVVADLNELIIFPCFSYVFLCHSLKALILNVLHMSVEFKSLPFYDCDIFIEMNTGLVCCIGRL